MRRTCITTETVDLLGYRIANTRIETSPHLFYSSRQSRTLEDPEEAVEKGPTVWMEVASPPTWRQDRRMPCRSQGALLSHPSSYSRLIPPGFSCATRKLQLGPEYTDGCRPLHGLYATRHQGILESSTPPCSLLA